MDVQIDKQNKNKPTQYHFWLIELLCEIHLPVFKVIQPWKFINFHKTLKLQNFSLKCLHFEVQTLKYCLSLIRFSIASNWIPWIYNFHEKWISLFFEFATFDVNSRFGMKMIENPLDEILYYENPNINSDSDCYFIVNPWHYSTRKILNFMVTELQLKLTDKTNK